MKRLLRRLWRLLGPQGTRREHLCEQARPAPVPPPANLEPPTPPRPLRTRRRGRRLTGEVGVTCHEGRVWIVYPVRLRALAMSPAETRGLAHALWAAAREAERAPAPEGGGL